MVEDGVCYKMGHGEVSECVTEPAPGPALSLRPRGGLARALYEKHQTDQFLSQFDKTQVSASGFSLAEGFFAFFPLVMNNDYINNPCGCANPIIVNFPYV
jgi:hypothetical protein